MVVEPVTATDSKGRGVDGLNASELILFDNNVPQATQVDIMNERISLAVAVQSSFNSVAILDKLGRNGIRLSQLQAGDVGETTLVSFSGDVRAIQDFTADSDKLTSALRDLRAQGNGVATLESLMQAVRMLGHSKAGERKVNLIGISSVVLEAQRQNDSMDWLTYSVFLLRSQTNRRL